MFTARMVSGASLLLFCLTMFAPLAPLQAMQMKGDAPERYVVKRGDTLWDICEDLYTNPWVWPKVWQMNPHITNPHWIYPGTELRVYYEVARYYEEGTAVEETAVAEGAPVVEEITPPPPPLPPPPKVPTITFSEIDQVGFITPFVPEGKGLILGGKRQRTLIGAADKIYVQFREGAQPEVGDRFFVFRTSLLFKHPITNKDVGYLNTILGVLEVVLVAPDHAKAVVVSSFEDMSANDKLMPYKKRSEEIALQPGAERIEGNIILAEWGTVIIAQLQVVFIDLGANDEIKAGHRFEVFQEPKALTSQDEEIVLSIQPIGELLVLAVEQETAAAVVTEALREFTPGERVRLITGE